MIDEHETGGVVRGNNLQKIREERMMSRAELARRAGLSALTIDRVESGRPCRLDTKRKILTALGFKIADQDMVFGVGCHAPMYHTSVSHESRNS